MPRDRLVTCNSVYRSLYAKSAPFIKPGVAFGELVRKGAEVGQYPQAGDDIDKFVAGRRRVASPGRWKLRKAAARRALAARERAQDCRGGTVGIRTDVTELNEVQNELAEANARVRETMRALQEQNDVLRDRDMTLREQNVLFDAALNNMSHACRWQTRTADHRVQPPLL